MRCLSILLGCCVVGCTDHLDHRTYRDTGMVADAAFDGGSTDAPGDAGAGAGADTPPLAPDTGTPDAGSGCTPIVTACDGCGDIPDGCGAVVSCPNPCTDGDIWCTAGSSMFATQVQASVQSVMDTRPELFDPVMFRDTSSWLVIDDAAYTTAVVAACNGMGLVCISDPNDDHEVRVRAPSGDLAENHGIRVHSSNRTWYRYQGVCRTTAF